MLARRKVMIAATLSAAVLSGVVLTSAGLAAARKAKPRAGKDVAAPAAKDFTRPDPPPRPTWKGWRVEVRPGVAGAERASHLALAKVLSAAEPSPAGRAAHFQAFDNQDYRLDGWHAFVESSHPTPGGALVTLRVSPRLASSYGASVTVLDSVLERYEVTDGGVRYVDTSEPPGGARHGVITD